MNSIHPSSNWNYERIHAELVESIDRSFTLLSKIDFFETSWINNDTYRGENKKRGIKIRQAPMLGLGGWDSKPQIDGGEINGSGEINGRTVSGFYNLAKKYLLSDNSKIPEDKVDYLVKKEMCGFDRYSDFQLYTFVDSTWNLDDKDEGWFSGKKRLILAAEVESNDSELKGEMTNLLAFRCPFKYLFISSVKDNLDERLDEFTSEFQLTDCSETYWFVIRIPDKPFSPKDWETRFAKVDKVGDRMMFRQYTISV